MLKVLSFGMNTRPEMFVLLIHCTSIILYTSYARLLTDAVSVHRHRELDECCKYFCACIRAKGRHVSI